MDKAMVLEFFSNNFDEVMNELMEVAIYADSPDKEVCSKLANGLKSLAENGEKRAAALYCAIAAYDNNGETFSPETGAQLVLELDAFQEYKAIIKELFEDVMDEYDFQNMTVFPIIEMLNSLDE